MSKAWRNILIIVLVVALLAGALVFLLLNEEPSDSNKDTSNDETTEEISLIAIDRKEDETASPIQSATISSPTFGSFTVDQRKDGALSVTEYADLTPNTSLFESLENTLTKITAMKQISENVDPSVYGFDKPQATFNVTYTAGKTYAFEFGNEEPFGTGDYFRFAGSNTVYLVDTLLLDSLALNPKAYINTVLYSTPVLPEATATQEVEGVLRDIDFSGSFYGNQSFAFRMLGDNDTGDHKYTNYLITKPFVRSSDSDKLGDEIITATTLTASLAVVPRYTKQDLKTYGLSDPYIVAKLHTAAYIRDTKEKDGEAVSSVSFKNVEEHTVTFSKPDKNGTHYVIVDDNPTIYEITGDSVAWFGLTYEDSISPLLFLKDITSVETLTLTLNGNTTEFALTHYPDKEDNDEKLTVTANKQTISTGNFRSFYQVLMGISRTGSADKTPVGTPDMRLQIETKDSSLEIRMYADGASIYLVENQGEIYKTTASQVRNLQKQLENLLEGKDVMT